MLDIELLVYLHCRIVITVRNKGNCKVLKKQRNRKFILKR